MKSGVVMVAGGSGSRMGSEIPKQFLLLAGIPVLVHTLRRFLTYSPDIQIVLVLPAAQFSRWESLAAAYLDASERSRITLCEGGATRTLSVGAGLRCLSGLLPASETLVAVHDGVRPLVSHALIGAAYAEAGRSGAAVACVPVKATLRERVSDTESRTVDRSRYYEVQTPQTFRLDLILRCFEERPHDQFSDDAGLCEHFGHVVTISPGSYDNLKITTPEDLFVAERLLGTQS